MDTKDKLKEFIDGRRDEFDPAEPPAHLWEKIDSGLRPSSFSARIRKMYPWAGIISAAAILIVALGFILRLLVYNEPMNPATADLRTINPQLAAIEKQYSVLISEKKAELNQYDLMELGLKDDFENELHILDTTYVQLKRELIKNPKSSELNNAMMHNLKLRIELLERQLKTLIMIKNIQNEEDRKIDA